MRHCMNLVRRRRKIARIYLATNGYFIDLFYKQGSENPYLEFITPGYGFFAYNKSTVYKR
jgi:hypothetical protein